MLWLLLLPPVTSMEPTAVLTGYAAILPIPPAILCEGVCNMKSASCTNSNVHHAWVPTASLLCILMRVSVRSRNVM